MDTLGRMYGMICIAAVAVAMHLFLTPADAQRSERINFKRGESSAVVAGRLTGFDDSRVYLLRVRAGQTIRTEQVGNGHYITIYITGPAGQGVGDSDASCNNRREITPTAAGDYLLRVVECRKADPWRGRFRFRVSVQ